MRKVVLVLLLIASGTFSGAQSVYKYHFWNSMAETGTGPNLTSVCADSFVTDTFPAYSLSRPVYSFDSNCGINFEDVGNFLSTGSYTIEMYVALDTVTGYRKMIDYKNRTTDDGLYVNDSSLTFYDSINTASPVYMAGQYVLTAISRNGSTQQVRMFANGNYLGSFTDVQGIAYYDAAKMLRFFQDDTTTTDESPSGKIAYLAIYNGERDSLAIHNDYDSLGYELASTSVKNVTYKNNIQLWPNPAEHILNISTTQSYPYTVYDLSGRALITGILSKGDNSIPVDKLYAGLYFIKLQGTNELGVYKFIKR